MRQNSYRHPNNNAVVSGQLYPADRALFDEAMRDGNFRTESEAVRELLHKVLIEYSEGKRNVNSMYSKQFFGNNAQQTEIEASFYLSSRKCPEKNLKGTD